MKREASEDFTPVRYSLEIRLWCPSLHIRVIGDPKQLTWSSACHLAALSPLTWHTTSPRTRPWSAPPPPPPACWAPCRWGRCSRPTLCTGPAQCPQWGSDPAPAHSCHWPYHEAEYLEKQRKWTNVKHYNFFSLCSQNIQPCLVVRLLLLPVQGRI